MKNHEEETKKVGRQSLAGVGLITEERRVYKTESGLALGPEYGSPGSFLADSR